MSVLIRYCVHVGSVSQGNSGCWSAYWTGELQSTFSFPCLLWRWAIYVVYCEALAMSEIVHVAEFCFCSLYTLPPSLLTPPNIFPYSLHFSPHAPLSSPFSPFPFSHHHSHPSSPPPPLSTPSSVTCAYLLFSYTAANVINIQYTVD